MGEVWQDDDESRIAEFVGRNSDTEHGIIDLKRSQDSRSISCEAAA